MAMHKKRIFDKLTANYAAVTGVSNAYVCPLCLRSTFSSVRDPGLSWDHVPPQSIGGRLQLPVCSGCNWTAGRTIEADLDRHVKKLGFLSTYGVAEAVILEFPGTGIRHRNALSIQDGTIRLVGRDEANIPEATHQAEAALAKAFAEGSKFVVARDPRLTWSRKYLECAFLKAAYLFLFSRCGYGAILQAPFELVRHQIAAPDSDVVQPLVRKGEKRTKPRRMELAVVNAGQNDECLVVYFGGFKLDTDTIVLLPTPGDADLRKYHRARDSVKAAKTFSFTPEACAEGRGGPGGSVRRGGAGRRGAGRSTERSDNGWRTD
jgi:hypothetical protein